MPIRPPRLTVRRLMIAVALVAVAIGGWIEATRLRRLSQVYSAEAVRHKRRESVARMNGGKSHEEWLAECRRIDLVNEAGGRQMGMATLFLGYPSTPQFDRELADHHRQMRLKYERAARYPWLTVEPDPPRPVWDGVVRP